ncbi:MAG: hypothetical protein IPK19_11455 [Chloroflexi bacterium]|nr:hypothetical protein [Chloroflexota bacterium]
MFLDLLGQLLAGGICRIEPLGHEPRGALREAPIVGYRDERYIYLLPNVALSLVTKAQTLHFTPSAIGGQLKEEGILVSGGRDSHHSVQIRIHGDRVRVWRLKSDCLGGDSGGSGDG